MTKTNLVDAVEICLQSMEHGADLESCLVLFPELAKELRPILTAAVRARSASAKTVSVDVVRRGRARLLQAAAEMREQKKVEPVVLSILPGKSWRTNGFFGARFARLAFSFLAVIAFLSTGGTSLVNASTGALPGDQLYPVKRSWEGVRLIFVFDKHAKEELENEFDHERYQEIEELYSEKRIAEVNFNGIVQEMNDRIWVIDGLNIRVKEETQLSADIRPGALVQVIGETDDGHIKAQRIILLATPGVTPSLMPTSTATYTLTPQPINTLRAGDDGSETGGWKSNTPKPADNSDDDSSELQATSTRKSSDDDDSSKDNYTTPTPTGEHGDGDDEHDNDQTSSPTEKHRRATRTPTPTKDGH